MGTNFKIKKQGNFLVAFDLVDKKRTYGRISLITEKFVGDTRCLVELYNALQEFKKEK